MLCPLHHLEHIEARVKDIGVEVRGGGGGVCGWWVQIDLVQRLIPPNDHEYCHHIKVQVA